MATARPDYYCHKCQTHIGHVTDFECPLCKESFIEEVSPPLNNATNAQSRSTSNPRRVGPFVQYPRSTPFANTTIVFGGGPTGLTTQPVVHDDHINFGTLLQSMMGHIAGGIVTPPNGPYPFFTPMAPGNPGFEQADLYTILAQFINQVEDNNGPAPASESRINAIPTVTVTAEQARDNLQCAICMDDFKENEQAKRLPCSHHFHEKCISQWLRLHGTCPTCRVTLDGDNTSNREYFTFSSGGNSSTNNNRRNDRNNPGPSSNSGSTLMDFD